MNESYSLKLGGDKLRGFTLIELLVVITVTPAKNGARS
ncbi:MAG: type II secretion system protein [Verrucomicrobiota bacterium]